MKRTQKDIVKEYLKEHGSISRNYCLSLRITRLGAIVCDINKELEWDIQGKDKDGDYVYTLLEAPNLPVKQRLVIDETKLPIKDETGQYRPVFKLETI